MSAFDRQTAHLHDRLHFLGLGNAERQRLASLQPLIRQAIGPALDGFYGMAKSHGETARFFASDAHIAHANRSRSSTGR